MVENGNEGYLNELTMYVQNKKGFINKKEREKLRLINQCINTTATNTTATFDIGNRKYNNSNGCEVNNNFDHVKILRQGEQV